MPSPKEEYESELRACVVLMILNALTCGTLFGYIIGVLGWNLWLLFPPLWFIAVTYLLSRIFLRQAALLAKWGFLQ